MLERLSSDLGVILRRDLVAAGVNDRAIQVLKRNGAIVSLRHGAYVEASAWRAADARTRHRMLSQAVLRLYRHDVALSHISAAIEYGAPDWRLPLKDAHLTSLRRVGERHQARVVHHVGICGVQDVSRRDGHWITAPARTALDTASILPRDPAVCVLDWFLEQQLTTTAALRQTLEARRETWSDHLELAQRLSLATTGAQSVAETRCRLIFGDQGLPTPVLQLSIFDRDGSIVGVVDFAWPDLGLVVEFDGDVKYHRHRRAGETIEQMVLREKRREDRIRELTGWTVIRVSWADLEDPAALAARVRARLRRAA